MRKHLYLITEHEDEDKIGLVKSTGSRLDQATKNEESRITVLDREEEDFRDVGKQVHLGYADFEDEDDLNERFSDVVSEKLGEIDAEHLVKAGHDPADYKEGLEA